MPAADPHKTDSSNDEALSFEDAMEQVETIVRDLEGDRVPLEKLLEGYATGTRLLKLCQSRIEEAQAKIEMVAAGRDGEKRVVPFDESAPPSPAGSEPASKASKLSKDDIRLF